MMHLEGFRCSYPGAVSAPSPPGAWQHLNFYGRYEFGKRPAPIHLEAIMEELAGVPIEDERTG